MNPVKGSSIRVWLVPAIRAVAVHPTLWATGLTQAWRLRRRGWWRHRPYLPLPDRDYLALRSVTAYGRADASPSHHDVVTYLHWCRAWPRLGPRRTGEGR